MRSSTGPRALAAAPIATLYTCSDRPHTTGTADLAEMTPRERSVGGNLGVRRVGDRLDAGAGVGNPRPFGDGIFNLGRCSGLCASATVHPVARPWAVMELKVLKVGVTVGNPTWPG